MADEIASRVIKRQEQLESDRGTWETHWQEVAERVLPSQATFGRKGPGSITQGEKRSEKVFDSTAPLAAPRCAAAIDSLSTPQTQRYHLLIAADPKLRENRDIKLYAQNVNDLLFQARYNPKANFASQAHEHRISLVVFGTGVTFVDEVLGQHIRYRTLHLGEAYLSANHQGQVDTVYRKFNMKVRQAVDRFGEDRLPDVFARAMRENKPEQEFEFIHCVEPRKNAEYGRRDYRGMPFASYYISIQEKHLVEESGFHTFPFIVSRWETAPGEVYGRSPNMAVLADTKMLNEMSKTTIRAAHMQVDPPVLLPEDGAISVFNSRPGAQVFGGLDAQGRQAAVPYNSGAKIDLGLEMMDQRRKVINDANLITLFQILVESPAMTATEALLRAQEKGALLAPTMGRQQSEFVATDIERLLDILGRAGMLPPMPAELMESGGNVAIEYTAPLNRLMKTEDAVAILRTIEALAPFEQTTPGTLKRIFNVERTGRIIADINGVPEKAFNSPEEIAAMDEQDAQQAQAAALLQAAPVAGKVIKDLSDARATAANVPQPQPGIGQ